MSFIDLIFIYLVEDDENNVEIRFINIKPIGECFINLNKLFRTDFHSVTFLIFVFIFIQLVLIRRRI